MFLEKQSQCFVQSELRMKKFYKEIETVESFEIMSPENMRNAGFASQNLGSGYPRNRDKVFR